MKKIKEKNKGKIMLNNLTDKLVAVGVVLILGFLIYIAGDAFFGLVGDIYRFLDSFIWAFFAGIIAFFLTITLTWFIIWISIITLSFSIAGIAGIIVLIFGK